MIGFFWNELDFWNDLDFFLELVVMIRYFWASISLAFSGMFWKLFESLMNCFWKFLNVLEVFFNVLGCVLDVFLILKNVRLLR